MGILPRSVIGGFRSALELERERLRRQQRSWWGPRNNILQAWAMTLVLFGGLVATFGPSVVPYLAIQAVMGVWLLETVNYVEHYGLLRRRLPNGRWARCSCGRQLELRPPCHQHLPVPPTAAQRSSRQSRAPISNPAHRARGAAATRGLCHHDRYGVGARTVAAHYGSSGPGALRRRPHPRQYDARPRSAFEARVEVITKKAVTARCGTHYRLVGSPNTAPLSSTSGVLVCT